jgi:hypothetical protein
LHVPHRRDTAKIAGALEITTMRTSTLLLAGALSLPALGVFAQTAPLGSGGPSIGASQSDAISEVFKSRGTPTGRVGGATRGLKHEEPKHTGKHMVPPLASAGTTTTR